MFRVEDRTKLRVFEPTGQRDALGAQIERPTIVTDEDHPPTALCTVKGPVIAQGSTSLAAISPNFKVSAA